MPLPGDNNTFGRKKGSYSPGDDNLDSTPYKPVPLAFQQADGTMPADGIDRNGNKGSIHRSRQNPQEKRKKIYCIAAIIFIVLILILALVLPLAICLGSDACSSSSSASGSEAMVGDRTYQGQLKGNMASPITSDPGNPPFGQFLNTTLEANTTTTSSTSPATTSAGNAATSALVTPIGTISTTPVSHRRKRQNQDGSGYSVSDQYLIEKIADPLLQSVKSSAICQTMVCADLAFDNFRLQNDFLSSDFNFKIGYDQPISMDPQTISNAITTTVQNFSQAFNGIFPGYRLDNLNLSFDVPTLCNYTTVQCSNFTDITDIFPTTTTILTTTITDRSILLGEIVPIFNTTAIDQLSSTTMGLTTSTASTTSMSTSTITSGSPLPRAGLADCSKFGFACSNQKDRVATRARCDGTIQCADGSDEQFCEQCRTSFSCPNGDGSWMCLRGKVFCDGSSICPTNVDESVLHCKSSCLSTEYQCRDANICIPKRWLCDGDAQCPQGDDETGCDLPSKCNNNAFYCAADQRCIGSWALCDGVVDCSNGADEEHCSCVECSGNGTALCSAPFGKCIQSRQICDGRPDCPNAEDEINCGS